MGSKWNYRVVAVTDTPGNQEDDELANDPQENVEHFGIIAVFYDEDTDKIVGSSDPEQAIMVANSLDNLRPEAHRLMAALEAPVLQTCDLPGHSDYVDPEHREVVTETFWSAGKANPVGGDVAPLVAAMDDSAIEPARGSGVMEGAPKSGEPDFSKATATESDDRQAFSTAVAPEPVDEDGEGSAPDVDSPKNDAGPNDDPDGPARGEGVGHDPDGNNGPNNDDNE